jgi:PST family polysaccharide transporter
MTLLRASLITGVGTVVRMATGLILNKIFAVYIGPGGLGQVAQLSSLAGIVNGIATGGVTTGVTRYVAEHGDVRRASPIVSTAFVVVCVAACISSLALVVLSARLAQEVFGSRDLAWVIWILAGANLLTAFNAAGVAVLNGRKRVAAIASFGIAGSLLSLIIGAWLTLRHGLTGALVAACLAPALPAVALGIYFGARSGDLALLQISRPDILSLGLLSRYSVMTLTAAVAGPTSLLLVRDHIAAQLSWDAAGHWQGVWKISEVYLTLVTSSLAVYFLPRVAELKETAELRRELRQALLTAVPAVAGAAVLIYLLRNWITVTLYSQAFLPMTELFPFQLLGDVVKIAGWLFAYLMLARAMTVAYVFTEIVFAATFFALATLFVAKFGLIGVSYAHALNYVAYLIVVVYLTRPLLATTTKSS